MKFKQERSVPLSKVPVIGGILLSLMIALIASAQGACQEADLVYATFGFCLPDQVDVVGDINKVENYTDGKDVFASILLDGNRVELHLLYPCQAPQKELDRADIKPFLVAFDPIFAQAAYNESVPGPALIGQIGNRDIIAYQPINQTIALLLMDVNMSSELRSNFLANLSIKTIEGATPIAPGSCPDTTIPEAAEGSAAQSAAASPETAPATGQEKMTTDIDAAKAQIEQLKKSI